MSASAPPEDMAEQPTLADVVQNINAIADKFQAWNEEATKANEEFKEWMATLSACGVVVVHEFRVANAIDDPDALVQYPDETVVAPPLPRTQRDATNISGEDAVKCLNLLFGPQQNMPVEAQLRREMFWSYLGLFGRKLY